MITICQKGSVQDILTRNFTTKGHVTEKQILDWTVQLCKAAAAFHNKGLAHRDIKVSQQHCLINTGSLEVKDIRL